MNWLGIDIGGTKTALALGDGEGRIRARRRLATPSHADPQRNALEIAGEARALLDEAGTPLSRIAAVGLAVPGPIDPERGALLRPPNLPGWEDAALRSLFSEALQRPVHLENDANAGALAEWRFGAGRGCDDLAYLTLSTGLGAGLVLGGRLYRGAGWNAGEIGHLVVEPEGLACACGGRGCLEAYIGGRAWTQRLRERTPEASLVALRAGSRARITPEHVVAAAGEGDDFALSELATFNEYLARGIAALAFVVAPERVILGTIATAAGDALCLDPVRECVAARIWPDLARRLQILPSGLGEGAAHCAGLAVAMHGEGQLERRII